MEPRNLPDSIEELLRTWTWCRRLWWQVHYLLGISATVSTITVASRPTFLSTTPYILDTLAWIAAICTGLVTFFLPSRKARSYVMAARFLTDACNRYRFQQDYKLEQLLDVAAEGEKIIATSDLP